MHTGSFIPLNKSQITIEDVMTQIQDSELWTSYIPLRIPCNVGDVIGVSDYGNQQYYITKSSETENEIDLPILKKTKIKEVEDLYSSTQVVNLIGGVTIKFSLKGPYYDLLKDRLAIAREVGLCSLEIVDLNNQVFQARDDLNSKRLPYIFINQIFYLINKISETNKLKKNDLVGGNFNTPGLVQNATSIAVVGLINIDVFEACPDINLDALIDQLHSKTNQQFLSEGYLQRDIGFFRDWRNDLFANKDENGKYKIFQIR